MIRLIKKREKQIEWKNMFCKSGSIELYQQSNILSTINTLLLLLTMFEMVIEHVKDSQNMWIVF